MFFRRLAPSPARPLSLLLCTLLLLPGCATRRANIITPHIVQSCDSTITPCLTFIPQPPVKSVVPWSVTLCVPSPGDYVLPVGRIYALMVANGITPMPYAAALNALTARQSQSAWSRIGLYAGWAVGGVQVLAGVRAFTPKPSTAEGLDLVSAFLDVLVPIARQQEPSFASLIAQISRDQDLLHPPVGACVSTVIAGSAGVAFNIPVK